MHQATGIAFTLATLTATLFAGTATPALANPTEPDSVTITVVQETGDPRKPLEITIETATPSDTRETLSELREESSTVAAGISHPVTVNNTEIDAIPSDPLASEQWSFSTYQPHKLWRSTRGENIRVAVVDTGIDSDHPDLAGQVVGAWDITQGDTGKNSIDPNGHGTHVAGIIAAHAGNGLGISGWAPSAELLSVRVLNAQGTGTTTGIAKGVMWAVENQADVINLSLGTTHNDAALAATIAHAISQGVTVVASAGNSGDEESSYPAAYPGVISVSAVNSDDELAWFSTRHTTVDVAAPGVNVLSARPDEWYPYAYERMNGTSQAAPHVTALAALLLAVNPRVSPETLIPATSRDAGPTGRDVGYGEGILDPQAALARACPSCAPLAPKPQPTETTPTPNPAKPQPQSPVQRAKQTVSFVKRMPLGFRAPLPARTTPGNQRITWKVLTPKTCRVAKPSKPKLQTKSSGSCRLRATAPGDTTLAPLAQTIRIAIVKR